MQLLAHFVLAEIAHLSVFNAGPHLLDDCAQFRHVLDLNGVLQDCLLDVVWQLFQHGLVVQHLDEPLFEDTLLLFLVFGLPLLEQEADVGVDHSLEIGVDVFVLLQFEVFQFFYVVRVFDLQRPQQLNHFVDLLDRQLVVVDVLDKPVQIRPADVVKVVLTLVRRDSLLQVLRVLLQKHFPLPEVALHSGPHLLDLRGLIVGELILLRNALQVVVDFGEGFGDLVEYFFVFLVVAMSEEIGLKTLDLGYDFMDLLDQGVLLKVEPLPVVIENLLDGLLLEHLFDDLIFLEHLIGLRLQTVNVEVFLLFDPLERSRKQGLSEIRNKLVGQQFLINRLILSSSSLFFSMSLMLFSKIT